MNPIGPYVAAIHLQDMLDEAARERRARMAAAGGRGIPRWRRSLGGAFASAARRLDPCVELRSRGRAMRRRTGALAG